MRKYLYRGAAGVAALCTALTPATAAFADTGGVLTVDAVGGANVEVGDTITAALAATTAATFYTSTTETSGVSCAQSTFSATATANPPAPGVATETLDAQTFGDCTSNIAGTTGVRSVTLNNLTYGVSVDSATGAVTVSAGSTGVIQSTVVINTLLGAITCVYQPTAGTLTGVADNAANSITFTNQQFDKVSGSALCPATAYFSATYSPVLDATQGGPVFVNAGA